MGKVVNITAVFPLRHTAIMIPTAVSGAHSMGVANEERANLILDAEIDHLPDSFVPKIAHAPLDSATNLVLRPLELLPTTGVLLAAALLFGELAELFTPLPFKTADTTPGHDQGLARVR